MNPQHTMPTLTDDDFIIWDSHAICAYLIDKYAPDSSLYPKDLQQRALIDQRLHFDSGVLFPPIRAANIDVYTGGTGTTPDKIDAMHTGLDFLEKFLTDSPYLVGDQVTLADLSCSNTISCYGMHFAIDEKRYPNVCAWVARLSELPYYDEFNGEPTKILIGLFNDMKEANAAAKAQN